MPDSMRRPFRVLLLTDDDSLPSWTPDELIVSRRMMELMVDGLAQRGYEFEVLPVLEDLSGLDRYDRREWLVFNWVEEFDGRP